MAVSSSQTDLDLLTSIMKAKQNVIFAERQHDEAKNVFKQAKLELAQLLDGLEPHVASRRDQLNLPKFPAFGDQSLGEKGET
jgi:hypothetical protein